MMVDDHSYQVGVMLHRRTIRLSLLFIAFAAGTSSPRADEPQPVVLSPEKYREMTAKIEAMQKQLAVEKGVVPSQCEIVGRMEKVGESRIAKLALTFQFRTTQPRQTVALGLKRAFVTDAKWADGIPPLAANEAGLTIAVEKPGDHRLEVLVEAAIAARGPKSPEVGFDLQLPGCPITILKWAGPAGVKRLRVGRRENPADAIDSRRQAAAALSPSGAGEAVGPATFLEVAWEEAAENGATKPRTARASWDVQVRDSDIQTAVVLALSGQVKEWRIAAPATASLSVARAGVPAGTDATLDPPPTIFRPDANQAPIWRITFPEALAVDLAVTVNYTQPRARDAKGRQPLPLGPVGVVDLPGQSGAVRIQSIPTLKVKELPRGDTKRQPGTDDPTEIALRYGNLPVNGNGLPAPPAELEIRPAVGVVQTKVAHTLALVEAGWRLRSEIAVQPVRAEVDRLELLLPVNRDLQNVQVLPPELVEAVESVRDLDEKTRLVAVRLASPQGKPFSIAVEGLYPVPATQSAAVLVLPRTLQTLEREGSVTVATPPGIQAGGEVREWEGDRPGTWTAPLVAKAGEPSSNPTAKLARAAGEVNLTWKARLPKIDASTVFDATVKDRSIRFDAEAHLAFAESPPARLRWKAAGATGPVRSAGAVLEGGNGEFSLPVPPPDADRRAVVRFSYEVPLPELGEAAAPQAVALPVFQLEAEGTAATRIRFWQESGNPSVKRVSLSETDSSPWNVLPPEIVPERESLPYLVAGTDRPFAGHFGGVLGEDPRAAAQTILWVDRVFAQSQTPDRLQRNRVRFLVRRWLSRQVDFALPADASEVEILLNGKAVNTVPLLGAGLRIRFDVPAWRPERTATLEFRYTRPGRTLGWADWQLPVPLTRSAVGPCRWQIALPGRSLPLAWSDAEFEEAWSSRSGLPFPGASRGVRELDRWFESGEEPTESAGWQLDESGITARQDGLEPLRALLVPRYGSLAIASSLVCLLGYLGMRSRYRLGFALAVPALLLAVHLGNPQWLPTLLACALPGVVGFLALVGLLRYREWQYGRQRSRLTGFQPAGEYVENGRAATALPRPLSGILRPSTASGGPA